MSLKETLEKLDSAEARVAEMYDTQMEMFTRDEVYPREMSEMQLHWLGNIAALLVDANRQLAEIADALTGRNKDGILDGDSGADAGEGKKA